MTGPHTVTHASSLRFPRGARTSVDGAPVLVRAPEDLLQRRRAEVLAEPLVQLGDDA